jgi:hypothetical protein
MPGRLVVILGAGAIVVAAGAILFYSAQRPAPVADAPPARRVLTEPAASAPAAAGPERLAAERPAAPLAAPAPVEAPPTTGSIRIESDVPDTSVFVDRVYLGTAPLTKTDLAPGPHVVLLSPTGYDSMSETVTVSAGAEQRVSMSFTAVRLDASIQVVHKHAFGSCQGTLKATPQGLTYETANRGDAFTAALTDVETFTVDYLEKNLRVKIRNGRTYNFTDPDGNADRLFVFHRDVDNVRKRLGGRE